MTRTAGIERNRADGGTAGAAVGCLLLSALVAAVPAGAAAQDAAGRDTAVQDRGSQVVSGREDTTGADRDTDVAARDAAAAIPLGSDGARTVSLEEALATAVRNNPALTRSRARADAARAGRLRATGDFLPSVSLGYDLDRTSTGRVDATGQTFTSTNNAARISGSLELFSGFRRFRQLESSRREVAAEEARIRDTRYGTVLDVKRAFFDAVANRELVRVQEDRVERQENQLDFVRQRVIRGKSTHSDSLRSRVELNDARVALIRARSDARAATFTLARAMGVRDRVVPEDEARLAAPGLRFGREEIARLALASSPALEAAEADARAAEARRSAARSSYLPTLQLQGGYDWRAESFPPDQSSWSLTLSASYPLFNGFDREADVRQAESDARTAAARRLEEELTIRAEVDDAYNQIEAARATVELAEESVALSREDLRVSRERYRLGLATIVDLQAAETGLADAEAKLVQRRFELRLGLARLESLLGRGLDDPELSGLLEAGATETGEVEAGEDEIDPDEMGEERIGEDGRPGVRAAHGDRTGADGTGADRTGGEDR